MRVSTFAYLVLGFVFVTMWVMDVVVDAPLWVTLLCSAFALYAPALIIDQLVTLTGRQATLDEF